MRNWSRCKSSFTLLLLLCFSSSVDLRISRKHLWFPFSSGVGNWNCWCHSGGLRFQLRGRIIPSCVSNEYTTVYSQKNRQKPHVKTIVPSTLQDEKKTKRTICRTCRSYSKNVGAGSLKQTDMFRLLEAGFLSSCALPVPPEAKCFVVP